MSPASQPGFSSPRVLIPFLLVTLIWGSTWLVIKDQLGPVPAEWSVTYRFAVATAAMFIYARMTGASFKVGRRGHLLALAFGLPQFLLNFNFVYAAEEHVTSGLVAVMYAMLLVPNSLLAWAFLGHKPTRRFAIGSLITVAGTSLLFVQEMRSNPASNEAVLLGIGLSVGGVLSASVANVLQATKAVKAHPIASLLTLGMLYGTIADAVFAWVTTGPPVIETRVSYLAGTLYLGLLGSALAFTLYFAVIRAVGPGKAAYSGLLVPMIAMALSTLFEDYHWSALAVAGGLLALTGLFIALRSARPGPAQATEI